MSKPKTLFVGSDHAAKSLKDTLISHIQSSHKDIEVVDCGTHTEESVDYPDFGKKVAQEVQIHSDSAGILCCGTGIGISMAANKFKGIRAAVVHDAFTAEMAKAHNNANILCMGARVLEAPTAIELVEKWLSTPFEGGRHERRIDKIELT